MQIQQNNMIKVIALLDTRSLKKVTKEIDSIELAKAVRNEDKPMIGKLLINLPKPAAVKLLDDLVYSDSVPEEESRRCQEKVLSVIQHLEERGKIAV